MMAINSKYDFKLYAHNFFIYKNMNKLYEINDLIEGEIINRPSTKIKTPFVADIKIISNNKIKN